VVPRFLGGVIALPLLVAIFDLIGLFGAQLIGVGVMGVDRGAFWSQTQAAVELRDVAVFGPAAVRIAHEHGDQTLRMRARDLAQRPALARLVDDGEVVAVGFGELAQGLDHQERRREPDRSAPVRVAALDLAVGLARFVIDRTAAEHERRMQMHARETAQTEVREELVGIDEPLEHALQLMPIDDRERERVAFLARNATHATRHDVLAVVEEPVEVAREFLELGHPGHLETLDRVQRNESHHRTHAQLLEVPVGITQHVVEEAVLLVPQIVRLATHALHRRTDVDVVLEEFGGQTLVGSVLFRELERDAHHVETEQSHPARRIGLLEYRTTRQLLRAVEQGDVVQPQKPAFEHVVAAAVDLVHPPGEVDQKFVEATLEEGAIRRTRTDTVHVVHAPDRPRVHGRVQIREFPLVSRNLSVRVLELLEQHEPQLFLGEIRIDDRDRDGVEREVPGREPRVLPFVRHRQHAHRIQMAPVLVADVEA
ncbi:MAG: hypothetical protein EBR51_01905, partial [Gammaproteobacteria bacterium]|nr:hypothetical protein [Gammaproteobacteria bacterium]